MKDTSEEKSGAENTRISHDMIALVQMIEAEVEVARAVVNIARGEDIGSIGNIPSQVTQKQTVRVQDEIERGRGSKSVVVNPAPAENIIPVTAIMKRAWKDI